MTLFKKWCGINEDASNRVQNFDCQEAMHGLLTNSLFLVSSASQGRSHTESAPNLRLFATNRHGVPLHSFIFRSNPAEVVFAGCQPQDARRSRITQDRTAMAILSHCFLHSSPLPLTLIYARNLIKPCERRITVSWSWTLNMTCVLDNSITSEILAGSAVYLSL